MQMHKSALTLRESITMKKLPDIGLPRVPSNSENSSSPAQPSASRTPKKVSSSPGMDHSRAKGIKNEYLGQNREIIGPSSKTNIYLKTFGVDPDMTWVNPDINPRRQDWLDQDANGSISRLRNEIVSETQRNPVLARYTEEGENKGKWEIIDGSRRRAAVLLENAKRAEVFPLLIQTGKITDEDARVLARAELKGQHKLSPYERAMQIKKLIAEEYNGLSSEDISTREDINVDAITGYKTIAAMDEAVINLLVKPIEFGYTAGLALARLIATYNKDYSPSLVGDEMERLTKKGTKFDNTVKLLAHFRKIKPKDPSTFAASQYVGKYKDNKTGAVSFEVKAVRDKPGEFALRVHAGSGDLMDELLKAAEKLASKSS